ncbi:hypothetical protein EYZ11_011758 [Aspergillus tanneri]|uniref:Uncharacterized protein n=1 Tax=Aspergillus tanneri TaxID=1220188 RepID=A0A4S3J7B5_9EURO|nr:hypothetical protein EYZ11_011758 [Aspergillus tanneri]
MDCSSPPDAPEARNLKILGSWNGEFDWPVRLRISLEVQSSPGTKLRLLDTNGSAAFLKAASVRLMPDDCDQGNEPYENDSPFPHVNQPATIPAGSLPSAQTFSDLQVTVAKPQDTTKSIRLGKRSAEDACLSDSASDTKAEGRAKGKRPSNSNIDQTTNHSPGQGASTSKPNSLVSIETLLDTAREDKLSDEGLSKQKESPNSCKAGGNDAQHVEETGRLHTMPALVTQSPNTSKREETKSTESSNANLESKSLGKIAWGVEQDIPSPPVLELSRGDPSLALVSGNILVGFPSDAERARYRIELHCHVYVDEDYLRGWSTVRMPGLPNLRAGETGAFRFLLPEGRGLEFRTLDLLRCTRVEDFLFAEFKTRDLVIPMRVCGRKFYGFLKEFALGQQVTVSSDSENDGPAKYYAMCSVRLDRRYVCSEKCSFSFCLDGGPEGSFYCELEPQVTGLQVIQIPTQDAACTGISRIQIICAPKDLEVFCLTCHGEWNREHLQEAFTALREKGFFSTKKEHDAQPTRHDTQPTQLHVTAHASHQHSTTSEPLSPAEEGARPVIRNLIKAAIFSIFISVFTSIFFTILEKTNTMISICLYDNQFAINITTVDQTLDNGSQGHFGESIFQNSHSDLCSHESFSSLLKHDQLEVNDTGSDIESERQLQVPDGGTEPIIGSLDKQVNMEDDGMVRPTSVSMRDKVDYWLGWRGPVGEEV